MNDETTGNAEKPESALVSINVKFDGIGKAASHAENVLNNLGKGISRGLGAAWRPAGNYFEALSEAKVKEVKANSEVQQFDTARVLAERVAEATGDEALARRLVQRNLDDLVQFQINRDAIALEAADYVAKNFPDDDTDGEIDSDWLSEFWARAEKKSGQEIRTLFGRVLALESLSPGSFSLSTLAVLSTLDREVAPEFEKLCNMSVFAGRRAYVIVLGGTSKDPFEDYGLQFEALMELDAAGLIAGTTTLIATWEPDATGRDPDASDFNIGGKGFTAEFGESGSDSKKTFDIIAFTNAGIEIASLISLDLNDKYVNDLRAYLKKSGWSLLAID